MAEDWTDEEFLLYVETHSKTERALFQRENVIRLIELAGGIIPDEMPTFVEMHDDDLQVTSWLNEAWRTVKLRESVDENTIVEGKKHIFTITEEEELIASLEIDGSMTINPKFAVEEVAAKFWESVKHNVLCPNCEWPLGQDGTVRSAVVRCGICERPIMLQHGEEERSMSVIGSDNLETIVMHNRCYRNAKGVV